MATDLRNLFDLQGRVAMVTGAGQGVGRAIAHTFALYGAGGIAVNDFYAERAEAVVAELRAEGVTAWPMVADVSDLDQVSAGVAEVERELGPISILVNNAGNFGPAGVAHRSQLFWETEPSRWRQYLDVNLHGVMNCCHAVIPAMTRQGYGRIVTIVSDAGRHADRYGADYAAAKAGAAGFMRALAADAAQFGITANSVSLSTILPAMAPEAREQFLASERTRKQLSRYLIRRFGRPEDVVGTVLLLCSDAAGWTTGQTYPVNGGYSSAL